MRGRGVGEWGVGRGAEGPEDSFLQEHGRSQSSASMGDGTFSSRLPRCRSRVRVYVCTCVRVRASCVRVCVRARVCVRVCARACACVRPQAQLGVVRWRYLRDALAAVVPLHELGNRRVRDASDGCVRVRPRSGQHQRSSGTGDHTAGSATEHRRHCGSGSHHNGAGCFEQHHSKPHRRGTTDGHNHRRRPTRLLLHSSSGIHSSREQSHLHRREQPPFHHGSQGRVHCLTRCVPSLFARHPARHPLVQQQGSCNQPRARAHCRSSCQTHPSPWSFPCHAPPPPASHRENDSSCGGDGGVVVGDVGGDDTSPGHHITLLRQRRLRQLLLRQRGRPARAADVVQHHTSGVRLRSIGPPAQK